MPRLFVALPMPETVEDALIDLIGGIPGARWLRPGEFHVTLRFLGELGPERAVDVAEALDQVEFEPFDLSLRGVGHFPPRGAAKALWAGVTASEPLLQLYRRIDRTMARIGLPADERKFHPHVTVARMSGTPDRRVAEFLVEHALFRTDPYQVDGFCLFSSTGNDEGARYVIEQTYGSAAKP